MTDEARANDQEAHNYVRRKQPCELCIAHPAAHYESRTVIVVGSGRGGTTAIAGAVHALGIRMAEPDPKTGLFPLNMEDPEIVLAGLGRNLPTGAGRHTAVVREISRLIEQRSDRHANWGWKDPNAAGYLEAVLPRCRNPLVVFVVRNALDLTLSLTAASVDELSIERGMDVAFSTYIQLWNILKKCGVPTLLVSYERLLQLRELFVDQLADFLRLAPTPEQRATAIDFLRQEGGYHWFDQLKKTDSTSKSHVHSLLDDDVTDEDSQPAEAPVTRRPTLLEAGCEPGVSRSAAILYGLTKEGTVGAEIGPFYNPIAAKRDGWRTLVVDFANTEKLRAAAESHSSPEIRAMASNIEEVEIVWLGEPLDELIRVHTTSRLNYLIASHAIEHLPDLLGFLRATERVMAYGGIMSLAVPDMRYTFDFFFAPSTLGQVLAAHRECRRRHLPEQVFDAVARNAWSNGAGCWVPGMGKDVSVRPSLLHAWKTYQEDMKAVEYRDCHAWYFTPSSFELLMLECWQLGLTGFIIKTLTPSSAACFGSEFLVQLERRRRPTKAERQATAEAVDHRRQELLGAIVVELAERVTDLPEKVRQALPAAVSDEPKTWLSAPKRTADGLADVASPVPSFVRE